MTIRSFLVTAAKILFVAGLIYWMVQAGKLDFSQLRVLRLYPQILGMNILLWALGYLALGGLRWFLLLRGLGLVMTYRRILVLQLIGFFFNTAIPGAVGGDIIKAFYVIKEQKDDRKTPAMLTILLDRIVGLAALFCMATTAVLSSWDQVTRLPQLLALSTFVLVGTAGLALGTGWVLLAPDGRDPVQKILAWRLPGFRLLQGIYAALRSYREAPRYLAYALGLSMLIQVAGLLYARELTMVLSQNSPELGLFSLIFPLGVMTTALPLAPGGLGVGHVAFDKLFGMVGLQGGANVFNVMVLTQLALNLIGVFPYLLYRRAGVRASDSDLNTSMVPTLESEQPVP